jgi:hypothetical protein
MYVIDYGGEREGGREGRDGEVEERWRVMAEIKMEAERRQNR